MTPRRKEIGAAESLGAALRTIRATPWTDGFEVEDQNGDEVHVPVEARDRAERMFDTTDIEDVIDAARGNPMEDHLTEAELNEAIQALGALKPSYLVVDTAHGETADVDVDAFRGARPIKVLALGRLLAGFETVLQPDGTLKIGCQVHRLDSWAKDEEVLDGDTCGYSDPTPARLARDEVPTEHFLQSPASRAAIVYALRERLAELTRTRRGAKKTAAAKKGTKRTTKLATKKGAKKAATRTRAR